MDFKNGVGVEEKDVKGLSDMLINTLYETGKFSIVERSQIDQVIKEQGFQQSGLTNEQLAEMGNILGVKSVLVGTVNLIASEYNVDVRAVDVESGEIVTTAGANKTPSITYRAMMEKIGKKLADNLILDEPKTEPVAVVVEKPKVEEPKPEKQHFRKSGFTLRPELGYTINIAGFFGPTAMLAMGYQVGPHFTFGIVGGYGGTQGAIIAPVMGNIRMYLIDHKYSFLIDLSAGVDIERDYGCYSGSVGFAFGNFETAIGIQGDVGPYTGQGLNINLSYRFGNIIKKWW